MRKSPLRRERIETLETDGWKPLPAEQQPMLGVPRLGDLGDVVVRAAADVYPALDLETLSRLLTVASAREDGCLAHQLMMILAARESKRSP